jgi:hypothetical protein
VHRIHPDRGRPLRRIAPERPALEALGLVPEVLRRVLVAVPFRRVSLVEQVVDGDPGVDRGW